MNNPNPVDAAIKAAQDKAAATAAAQPIVDGDNVGNVVDTVRQTTNNNVAQYVPAKPKTLSDLGSSGLNVDNFIKVSEHGLEIKGKEGLIEKIVGVIDTSSKGIAIFEGVRFGNPAQYLRTYDGAKCATGGTWADAVAKAQRVDPSVRPYEGADITITTTEDVLNIKGQVVVPKGTVLGHSTSITNKANLVEFKDKIIEQNLINSLVQVELGSERRTNAKSNAWGVITFNLIGEYQAK